MSGQSGRIQTAVGFEMGKGGIRGAANRKICALPHNLETYLGGSWAISRIGEGAF
jgi:hypothetical protein